jgi:hypothetical protein
MIKLIPSTQEDIDQLTRWIQNDPYHKDCLDPIWWLTGVPGSLLSFRLDDDTGSICYVRLDPKDLFGAIRLHTQFAPRGDVQKLRLVKAMIKCVPIVLDYSKQQQANLVVFQSTSKLLIDFMKRKFGFEPAGGSDYQVRVAIFADQVIQKNS